MSILVAAKDYALFASHSVMSRVDPNTVRELLGHKDIEMTLRYFHLSPSHKCKAIEVLDSYCDIEMDTNMNTKLQMSDIEISVSA